MADELISVKRDQTTITFNLYWYKAHHDMQISEHTGDELTARILFVPDPVTLRTIADQFYEWAGMLENHYHDLAHESEMNNDDETLAALKQKEQRKEVVLPKVLSVEKKPFKRTTAK